MAKIKCPGCDNELDASDLQGQMQHMQTYHLDIIYRRLCREGLWDRERNRPVYPRDHDPLIGYAPPGEQEVTKP
jgi:hypothetical protein